MEPRYRGHRDEPGGERRPVLMRVLHVISGIARRYGGPSYAIAGLCRALRADGVDVEIATTDADGPKHSLSLPDIQPMFGDVPLKMFHRHLGESLKYSRDLGKWLGSNARGFDVVHIHAV